jgi:hypothetical protein
MAMALGPSLIALRLLTPMTKRMLHGARRKCQTVELVMQRTAVLGERCSQSERRIGRSAVLLAG